MSDDRREIDRYPRESLLDQAGDALRELWHSPKVLLVIGIIVVGWVVLVVVQPKVVQLEELRTGDCLYVPVPDSGGLAGGRPIGTTTAVVDGLVRAGAERTLCELSHGHEVAAAFLVKEPYGAAYPGAGALDTLERPACEDAFEAYVGRPPAGSSLELTVVVPGKDAWEAGRRAGACLVSNADGTFMTGRAGGSGR